MLNLVSQKHTPIPIGWWLSDPAVNRVAFSVILHLKLPPSERLHRADLATGGSEKPVHISGDDFGSAAEDCLVEAARAERGF